MWATGQVPLMDWQEAQHSDISYCTQAKRGIKMTQKKINTSNILGTGYYTYNITTNNIHPNIDETITISCNVQNVYNENIPNKTLTLYQNGVSKGTSTTDSNGLATWNIKCDERGLQQFKVENTVINIEVDSSLPYYRSKKITKNLDLSQSYGTTIVDNREAELYEVLLNDWEIIVTFNDDLSNNQFIGIITGEDDSTYLYYDSGYILSNQSNNIDFVSGFSKVKFCSINKRLGVYCYEQGEWVIEYASDDENYSPCGFFTYGNPEIEVEVTTELKIPQLYDTPITLIYDDTQLSNGVYYPPRRISEDEVWVLNVDFLQNDDIILLHGHYALLYRNGEIYFYDINSNEDIALIKEGDSIELIFVGTKEGTQCFIEEDYWIFNEYFDLDLGNLEQVTDDDGKSFNSEYSFHSYKDMGFIQKNNTDGLLRNDGTVDTTNYLVSLPTHNHDGRYYTETETNNLLSLKQDTLVSGTNLKTINNNSLLGSGNITINAGGSGSMDVVDYYYDSTNDELVISTGQLSHKIFYLTSSNYNPTIDTSFTITCTVTDMSGSAVANESVALYNNGTLVSTQTTNSTGEATWSITLSDWDNHHFTVNNTALNLYATGYKAIWSNATTNATIKLYRNRDNARLYISGYSGTFNTTWTQYGNSAFMSSVAPMQTVVRMNNDGAVLLSISSTGTLNWRSNTGASLSNKTIYAQIDWSIA